MNLSYRARRRWSLVILLVGLPVYVVAAVSLVNWLERPSLWVEFLVYVGLGFLWMMPFRFIFRGVGQPDPDAPRDTGSDPQH
jgi:putative flippase GtrA